MEEMEKEIQTDIKTHEERITNFRLKTLNKDVKYAGMVFCFKIVLTKYDL